MARQTDAEARARRKRESKLDEASNTRYLTSAGAGLANAQFFNFGDEIGDGLDALFRVVGRSGPGIGTAIRQAASANKSGYDAGNVVGSVLNIPGSLGASRVSKLERAFKKAEAAGDNLNAARIRYGRNGGLREVPERINEDDLYGALDALTEGDIFGAIGRGVSASGVGGGKSASKAARATGIGVLDRSDDLSTALGAIHGGALAAGGYDPNQQELTDRIGQSALGAIAGGIAGRYAPAAFDYAPRAVGQARSTAPRVLTYKGDPKNRDRAFDELLGDLARLDEQARRARAGTARVNSALGDSDDLGPVERVARRRRNLVQQDAPIIREFIRASAAGEGRTRRNLLADEVEDLESQRVKIDAGIPRVIFADQIDRLAVRPPQRPDYRRGEAAIARDGRADELTTAFVFDPPARDDAERVIRLLASQFPRRGRGARSETRFELADRLAARLQSLPTSTSAEADALQALVERPGLLDALGVRKPGPRPLEEAAPQIARQRSDLSARIAERQQEQERIARLSEQAPGEGGLDFESVLRRISSAQNERRSQSGGFDALFNNSSRAQGADDIAALQELAQKAPLARDIQQAFLRNAERETGPFLPSSELGAGLPLVIQKDRAPVDPLYRARPNVFSERVLAPLAGRGAEAAIAALLPRDKAPESKEKRNPARSKSKRKAHPQKGKSNKQQTARTQSPKP